MIRFGTDGIRGRVGQDITAEVAYAVGRAAADVVADGGRLALARDTRQSGEELARAVAAGAASAGADVMYLGIVPTPVLASVTVRAQVPGCMITASHNPYHDNGLKLFNDHGLKLAAEEERAVEEVVNETVSALTLDAGAGTAITADTVDVDAAATDLVDAYVADVVAANAEVDLSGFRVGFDFANGAGSYLGPRLFDQIKLAAVHYIGNEPTGTNINDGFGSTAPGAMMATVVDEGLDMAFAFDGDGDRVLAIDDRGQLVDGDALIAVLADDLSQRGLLAEDTVVVTTWSNLGLHKAMAARDIQVALTEVGDKHILELLNQRSLSLGGEQSGHIILRDRTTTGDGMLVAAEVLAVVARAGRPLSELAAEAMQRVPQVASAIGVTSRPGELVAALSQELATRQEQLGADGRVVLRPSGTEPVVRVMVEAPTLEAAQAIVDDLSRLVAERDAALTADRH